MIQITAFAPQRGGLAVVLDDDEEAAGRVFGRIGNREQAMEPQDRQRLAVHERQLRAGPDRVDRPARRADRLADRDERQDVLLRADAQRLAGGRPLRTFPAPLPSLRLDHVFVTPAHLRVTGVEVPRHALARVASDHLPLAVDFEVSPAPPAPDA